MLSALLDADPLALVYLAWGVFFVLVLVVAALVLVRRR